MAPTRSLKLLLVAAATTALKPTKLPTIQKQAKALGAAFAAVDALAPLSRHRRRNLGRLRGVRGQGRHDGGAAGMFFDECGDQSKACFTNPVMSQRCDLGNCRGEQECATRCFARFGSEKLNDWLSCTLEEKKNAWSRV